jgi:nicotinate-nucleotide adenylyltransferase
MKEKLRRIGILGGTFDPVHEGHLRLAETARRRFLLEAVVFVPAYRTPLKARRPAPAADRAAMLRLALRGLPFARLSLFEARRHGKSYTFRTLLHFRRRFGPDTELYFLAGSDVLRDLGRWRRLGTVLREARFAVAVRPGARAAKLPRGFLPIPMDPVAVSSTGARRALGAGRGARLVPAAVRRYARQRGLYRSPV